MTARVFVDTNILVYAHDSLSPAKQRKAAGFLLRLWESGNGAVSTQVLQEFYVNVTNKVRPPLAPMIARRILRDYVSWVHEPTTPDTVIRASEIAEAHHLSFWDSLIIASAEQQSAAIILTEDLNHTQRIAGIRIVNPFLDATFHLPA